MHLNYYFLRKLSESLRDKLTGFEVAACFSQEKDELVLGFTNGQEDFYIKAILTNTFAALGFPAEFHRKRQNSVDLFREMVGKTVEKVVQHQNERSFYLQLSDGFLLLFKLFGNRSNLILFKGGTPLTRFHKKFPDDFSLDPLAMGREISPDTLQFPLTLKELRSQWPTLGELPLAWLEEQHFATLPAAKQQETVGILREKLEHPTYYLVRYQDTLRLSLLALGELLETYTDPLEASQQFTIQYLATRFFDTHFRQAKLHLEKQRNAAEQTLAQTEARIKSLQTDTSYSQTADIIMANLHAIPPRTESIELFDFYRNVPRTIKLKATETPQKSAERLYKKAKNQQIELKLLEEKALRKTEEFLEADSLLSTMTEISGTKELKQFLKVHNLLARESAAQPESPFREFMCEGFKIMVGKSAANNDVLTQKMAHKDDLWLHAKDVSGSHVLIKYQAGKPFPNPVIEKAAQLAAWYSKRKSDSLCPVIYTPKKYVRKPKGAAAGSVTVDRENVILVTPQNPFERTF